MKTLYTVLIVLLLFCNITTASIEESKLYTIRVIVLDTDGKPESDVPVTFEYDGQSKILYSAVDGTLAFPTPNLGDVPDGVYINVSCKYGIKKVPIDYSYGITGVVFNEIDEDSSVAMWIALGFTGVVSLGGGLYYLIRKPKKEDDDDGIS